MKNHDYKSFTIKVVIVLIAGLLLMHSEILLMALRYFLSLFIPFLVGMSIAFIINLIMAPIEKKLFQNKDSKLYKHKRTISIILTLLIILGLLAILLYLVIPELYNSIKIVTETFPTFISEVKEWFLETTENAEWLAGLRTQVESIEINFQDILERGLKFIGGNAGNIVDSTVGIFNNIVGALVTVFVGIIFAFYLLSSKEQVGQEVNDVVQAYVPDHKRGNLHYIINILNDKYSNFFKGQLIDAIIVGIMLFVAMFITRLPYATTISIVVGATALIPMLGAFIGGGIGFLMIAATNITQAVIFLVVLLVIQQLDGDFVYPKVVGNSIGLPGIWTFLAVIVGGSLAGPIGMLLGVPLIAALYSFLMRDVQLKLETKKEIKHSERS